MSSRVKTPDPWAYDGLGFAKYGDTFTHLIKSLTTSKVISIEAGFGHGKTFFRRAWAQQLRSSGELVIEIDAQQSDHSGDPLITFLGALIAAQPVSGKPISKVIKDRSLKLAGLASKTILRSVLKSGAEELLDAASDWVKDQGPDIEAFDKAIEEIEAGMSKAASQLLVAHQAAEQARQIEFPKQIDVLHDALTEGAKSNRIIILIDELDRCHPEYSISLLEAMKLVFGRDGFVFCLMVNPNYLESIAHHRFGTKEQDELYLEKFIDLRLALRPTSQTQAQATKILINSLELALPFGQGEAFSVEAAAELAAVIVEQSTLSFRQIKRTVERLDLALRCYRDRAIDLPLLVFLAFSETVGNSPNGEKLETDLLPRAKLTREAYLKLRENAEAPEKNISRINTGRYSEPRQTFVAQNCSDLIALDDEIYALPPLEGNRTYRDWYLVFEGLGPRYIPEHQAMLDGVHDIIA